MNICFLDKTSFTYNSKDVNSFKLRGAETVLINLSNSLLELGHQVTVINNCQRNEQINNINWININNLSEKLTFDLVVSNNDCQLFDKVNSKKKILLSHSIQNIEKFIRKNQFFSYFKHKPKVALLGKYHLKKRSFITRMFGYFLLPYGIDEIFINTKLNYINGIDKDLAIFTSRSDRNLDLLINIWKNSIHPNFKSGKLLITPKKDCSSENSNIISRVTGDRETMINDLNSSRMFLVPGHEAELFCLAAEEARELCLPIITLGIGSLSERVIHGKTGFIAKNNDEFSQYAINIFKDDKLWNDLRSNLLNMRGKKTWKKCAQSLLNNI
jgi:glycosyltransferase involved in cell wall biosynthesis